MDAKMTQQEIDALIQDSMGSETDPADPQQAEPAEEQSNSYGQEFESYQESNLHRSTGPSHHQKQSPLEESNNYPTDEFESYEESHSKPARTNQKTGIRLSV